MRYSVPAQYYLTTENRLYEMVHGFTAYDSYINITSPWEVLTTNVTER